MAFLDYPPEPKQKRSADLCAVPECPNEAELFHPDRYVGLCRNHPDWTLAYGIVS